MTAIESLKTHLAEQIALADKASKGPWNARDIDGTLVADDGTPVACVLDNPDDWEDSVGDQASDHNLLFIASARTNHPKLCRQLQVALVEIENVPEALDIPGAREHWIASVIDRITEAGV